MQRKTRGRISLLLAGILLLTTVFSACGSEETPPDTSGEPTSGAISGMTTLPDGSGTLPEIPIGVTTGSTAATEPIARPSGIHFLTGLPVADESVNSSRPVAVVFNNLRIALPQHGIGAADLVFEVEAEGGITRLVAVYSDIAAVGTVGSVRSARPVMINIAMGLDCVFVHSGGSPQAYSDLSAYSVTDIDGLYDGGAVFYRDSGRANSMGYEHALMTTGSRLSSKLDKLAAQGTRVSLDSGYAVPFAFNEADTAPAGGSAAAKVTTKYGSYQPFFRYDEASGNYQRYQYGAKHIDNNTGEQLSFKNVVVLSVKSSVIKGDAAGRRQFSDVGSGSGLYATDGVSVPIKWSKASAAAPLKLTYEDGTELKLNPGKTFLSYVNGMENATVGN